MRRSRCAGVVVRRGRRSMRQDDMQVNAVDKRDER